VGEAMKWAEFAMLAEGHRRAGMLDQAEQLARSGLDEHPDCAEGALVMALVLLDQNQVEEAGRVIADWVDTNLGVEVTDGSVSGDTFGAEAFLHKSVARLRYNRRNLISSNGEWFASIYVVRSHSP